MAQYYSPQYPPNPNAQPGANLQFYSSNYGPSPVSGHTTPSQATYGGFASPPAHTASAYPGYGARDAGFGGAPGVSGRMGEQGGLRTGWLAAFGTEGYEGEPPLLEELGVNFDHIRTKVCSTVPSDILEMSLTDLAALDLDRPQPAHDPISSHYG